MFQFDTEERVYFIIMHLSPNRVTYSLVALTLFCFGFLSICVYDIGRRVEQHWPPSFNASSFNPELRVKYKVYTFIYCNTYIVQYIALKYSIV